MELAPVFPVCFQPLGRVSVITVTTFEGEDADVSIQLCTDAPFMNRALRLYEGQNRHPV